MSIARRGFGANQIRPAPVAKTRVTRAMTWLVAMVTLWLSTRWFRYSARLVVAQASLHQGQHPLALAVWALICAVKAPT